MPNLGPAPILRAPKILGEGPLADFKNGEELGAWLRKQPSDVAVALAARAALRALPFVQTAKRGGYGSDYFSEVVLRVFRATAASWAAAKYPAHETELARAAAVATSGALATAFAPDASRAYYAAARAAAHYDYAYAFRAAAARATFWSAVSIDATRVEQGKKASEIAGSWLWPNVQPNLLRSLWQELRAGLLAAKQDWQVWTIWYDDRLAGHLREEERERAYVRIEQGLWDQGTVIVNAEIKRWIEARTPPEPSSDPG